MWYVEVAAFQEFSVGRPIIPLYADEQSTTKKVTFLVIYCGQSPTVTESVIAPNGSILVPPKPTNAACVGVSRALVIPICWNAG